MNYQQILELLQELVHHGLLKAEGARVYVYREEGPLSPKGWYLEDYRELAQELLENPKEVEYLERKLIEVRGA